MSTPGRRPHRAGLAMALFLISISAQAAPFTVRDSDFVGGVYEFHYYTFPNTAPVATAKRTIINGVDQNISDPTMTNSGWEFGDPFTPGIGFWAAVSPFETRSTNGELTMGWDFSAISGQIVKVEMKPRHFLFQFEPFFEHAKGDEIAGFVATPNAFGSGSFSRLYSYVGGSTTITIGADTIQDITSFLPEDWRARPRLLELKFTYSQTPNPTISGRHLQIFRDNTGTGVDGFLLRVTIDSCTATAQAPGTVASAVPYTVQWSSAGTTGSYEVQEATASDFSNASTQTVMGTSQVFVHQVSAATTYYYRVRPVSCGSAPPSFGPAAQTVVLPPDPPSSSEIDVIVPVGTTARIPRGVQFENLPPGAAVSAFTDQPFLTVDPASGTVPSNGVFPITVTGDPAGLQVGANTGTVTLTATTADAKRVTTATTTTQSKKVSISLVTPVAMSPKGAPPADAIIIPAVAHLEGSGARFQSDVRITNANPTAKTYLLTFTPSNTDGTTTGRATSITVQPEQTIALNDVLRGFFGFAQPSDAAGGALELRSTTGPVGTTIVTSRTYATTSLGTFGQFIPAVALGKFLKLGSASLTLTQVSQGTAFRSNIGLVEGLGSAISGRLRVFNVSGGNVKDVPFSLKPFEFQQINSFLAANGVSMDDARIEIVVDSGAGGVTTYASVLDNRTQDPLCVSPIRTSSLQSSRYVLPGMAELELPATNFHSDVRIFNPGPDAVTATMTFYPQGAGTTPSVRTATLAPGQIQAYDNVLPSLFGLSSVGGSIVLTTPANSSLVVSGRTYSNAPGGGTYGQFIPAVTPADGIGAGDPALQLPQLEQSASFRTNVGLNELTGNPVTVEISLIQPDSKVTSVASVDLQPNEFRQQSLTALSGLGKDLYNARVVVRVTGGTGRVTAYASVIDNSSLDPTYVPAQK